MSQLMVWFTNDLFLNADQASCLYFYNYQGKVVICPLHRLGQKVTPVESVNIFGLDVDNNLSWVHHIEL